MFSMVLKGYQIEKHKGNTEEINNATTPKLQLKTLNWTLNNFKEVNASAEGWRPDSPLYSWSLEERKSQSHHRALAGIPVSGQEFKN